MAFEFSLNRKDALYIKSKANNAAGSNTDPLDLEQAIGGDIPNIAAELSLPAEALLSDTKILSFALQDSADGVNFTQVDPCGVITTQTGAGGVGVAAKVVRFRFPPNVRRYVRIAQTVTATPGTLSGSYTFSLLF